MENACPSWKTGCPSAGSKIGEALHFRHGNFEPPYQVASRQCLVAGSWLRASDTINVRMLREVMCFTGDVHRHVDGY